MKTKIEKEKIHTICPYCSNKLETTWVLKLDSVIGVRYVYICEKCKKTLGIFQKKVINIPKPDVTFSQTKIKPQLS